MCAFISQSAVPSFSLRFAHSIKCVDEQVISKQRLFSKCHMSNNCGRNVCFAIFHFLSAEIRMQFHSISISHFVSALYYLIIELGWMFFML